MNKAVKVCGTSRPDLNGQQGRVYEYSAASNRYTVLLADGKHVALRPEHLEVCPAAPPRRGTIMEKEAAFTEYNDCMGRAKSLSMPDLVGMAGTAVAEEFGKAAKLGAVVGCSWGVKFQAVALRMQTMAFVRRDDSTAARAGRECLTWALSSCSRSRLVGALACCATVSKVFPSKILREEQQAAATDPALRVALAAEAKCSRWKAEEAKTEGFVPSGRTVGLGCCRHPTCLPRGR
jgi:hypothetical protein